jgi:uncharacterized protein DUF6057
MQSIPESEGRRWAWAQGAYALGLFVLLGLYVQFCVRPEFLYHAHPVVFLTDWRFFLDQGFGSRPGGSIEYVSAFICALFALGWPGSVAVVLLTASICAATRRVIACAGRPGGRVLFLAPVVFMALLLGQYVYPVTVGLGLLAALLAVIVYVRLSGRAVWVRALSFVVLSLVVYGLAGGSSYVVFGLLCAIFELANQREVRLGVLCLVCAALAPGMAGAWLCDPGLWDSYAKHLAGHARIEPSADEWSRRVFWNGVKMHAAMLLFYPVLGLVVMRPMRAPPRPASLVLAILAWAALLVGGGTVFKYFDTRINRLRHLNCASRDRRWPEVLAHAEQLSPDDYITTIMSQVNRALYHEGKLLDEMFSWPQAADVGSLLFDEVTYPTEIPAERGDVLFDLGRVNEAERMAYEALQVVGEAPYVLKRLVRVCVIKQQPEAARVLLSRLSRSLLSRQWAICYRRNLDADPATANDPVVASRRELMVARGQPSLTDIEGVFLELLARNKRNRMAVEYLMAHYLLTRQLDKLAAQIGRLKDVGYEHLPRHCEEALVLHRGLAKSKKTDLAGYTLSLDTRRRARRFFEALRSYRNPDEANTGLRAAHGETYWYFYTCGVTTGHQFHGYGVDP